MASFTKTIPQGKEPAEALALLLVAGAFVPLAQTPTRAAPGDFIYLVFRGAIVGRARIRLIESAHASGNPEAPDWSKVLVHYTGTWQRPPRRIPLQGHQGVRYLDTQALEHLDDEVW